MHQDIIAVFILKGPSVWWADLISSPVMSHIHKSIVSLDPKETAMSL